MIWIGIIIGLIIGVGGYYLYNRYAAKAEAYAKTEEAKIKAKI